MPLNQSEINLEIIKHVTDKDDMINFIHKNPDILKLKETATWQNNANVIINCPTLLKQFILMKPGTFEKVCKSEKNCMAMIKNHPEIYKELPITSQTNPAIALFYLARINEQDIFSGAQVINTFKNNLYQKSDLHPDVFNDYEFCIKAFHLSNLIAYEFPEKNWKDKEFLVPFLKNMDKLINKDPAKTMHYVNLLPDNIKLELKDNCVEPGNFTDYFSSSTTNKIKLSV